ncbi:MAG: undecaprenyl-diphosphatase UppP [Candidatus Caenarcaniphilales bacterium]|nr:undecaprenyl-diphosphatase UppP [Candidatus Caenarcaniphilales bacterium]
MEKIYEIFRCTILGIVQGLTEFLPISSSFHLRVVPSALGWPEVGISLSVFLHLGTLVGVLLFFGKDLWSIFLDGWKTLFIPTFSPNKFMTTMAWKIIIGSIPAVFFGFFFHDFFEQVDNNFYITASCLIIVGLILWVSDTKGLHLKSIDQLTWQNALIIGFAQASALIPGVSRSGATISMARIFNFSREEAARFSFILGVPVIFGAGLLETIKVIKHPSDMEVSMIACLAGFTSAAVVGFLSIKFLLKFLQTYSLAPFVFYRIVLGGIVLFCMYKGYLNNLK